MRHSVEIETLVARWFAAATAGDAVLIDTVVSDHDCVCLIGSDPDEFLTGGQAVAEFLRDEVRNAGGRATFTPRNTMAFEEGDLGWAITHLTIAMPDGAHIDPRWSAIFHRRDDQWQLVHIHASIAVPNDAAGWVYPAGESADG